MENKEEIQTPITHPFILKFGEFNDENFNKFVDTLNQTFDLPNRHLYLNSPGGDTSLIAPLKSMIETGGVYTFAHGHIDSSAFVLYMTLLQAKEILPGTIGIFHYPRLFNAPLKPDNTIHYPSSIEKELYNYNTVDLDFFRELLEIDNKLHKKYLKGHDTLYKYEDLKKIEEKSMKLLGY